MCKCCVTYLHLCDCNSPWHWVSFQTVSKSGQMLHLIPSNHFLSSQSFSRMLANFKSTFRYWNWKIFRIEADKYGGCRRSMQVIDGCYFELWIAKHSGASSGESPQKQNLRSNAWLFRDGSISISSHYIDQEWVVSPTIAEQREQHRDYSPNV